jgi:SNF family Na+-dependent transporter
MTESLQTLQEFMFQTKGVLYLLAIGYLIGLGVFWKFLLKSDRNEDRD